MLEKTVFALSVWWALKTKDILMKVWESHSALVMPDIWIQEPDADSTTQECDQDSTNKGENYEEEPAKWESWLKGIDLTCPNETEHLKNPSYVYVLYVYEQICNQDT